MIETDRLILRPFREEDAADVFEYLKSPMVNCFACMKVHSLEEAHKAVMERAEDAEYTFAIVLQETGKVFAAVLEDAGVYKNTPEGREAFLRFIAHLNHEV